MFCCNVGRPYCGGIGAEYACHSVFRRVVIDIVLMRSNETSGRNMALVSSMRLPVWFLYGWRRTSQQLLRGFAGHLASCFTADILPPMSE